MKTLCQIGFVMVLSWFIVGCTHLPPKCNEITVQDDVLRAALEKAQLGESLSETDGKENEYTITPVREFKNDRDQTCYEYAAVVVNQCGKRREMTGKACRQPNGSWKTVK